MRDPGDVRGRVVDELADGPRSFDELAHALADVPAEELQAQLHVLERDGRVAVAHLMTDPPRTTYRLTRP